MHRRHFLGLSALAAVAPSHLSGQLGALLRTADDPPVYFRSLTDVARLLESGELTSVALTTMMFERIAAVDGRLKSYVTLMQDQALQQARAADEEIAAGLYRGPLHGVPIGIKDLFYTKGVRTMGGSYVLRDFVPEYDATVVARLSSAGAVILGKLVLCEAAQAPYYPGFPVPVNPWNAERWSGISSSGSGVATAAGLCFGSLGTDTGGSIRMPAAANGCVGLKPTYGRVSRHGLIGLSPSLDHAGPMTRTVADASIMFDAIAGHDPSDPTSLRDSFEPTYPDLDRGVAGLRVGIDRSYAFDNTEPDVAEAQEEVLRTLSRLGARIVDVQMPDVSQVWQAWMNVCLTEMMVEHAGTYPSRADEYGPGLLELIHMVDDVTPEGLAWAKTEHIRVKAALEETLSQVDCMVCPGLTNAARARRPDPTSLWGGEDAVPQTDRDFSKPFNMSGQPTLSVPSGFSDDGLPLGVQFVGRHLGEATILRVGHAFERASEWHTRHPNV